ncbi:cell wall-active antibiotics response protein [Aquibacillus halophilus]|uniref:Cell wall-active antibiotics response protein n=1 Tax=Aquibacillus halophilus TaxID=930132 RepID=A0A6A8DM25_9BACI|nr:cell wall-active antibiotics response protein LiaF [Aquibacillus halophilus]MRH44057.1 cell wall-active antibiotics response protein [Aquibacillus halophilus]
MINRTKIDIVDILLMATIILFLVELIFIDTGLLIFIAICSALIYFGKNSYYRTRGKVMFWLGISFIVLTVTNTTAFKFLLITVVIFLALKWYKSKQQPNYIKAKLDEDPQPEQIQQRQIFTNKWFGRQRTSKHAYEWQDVNIQAGIGDTIIDLNYTVIPKNEPVIFIRNIIGNVQIIVPYDVEISLNHSVMFGSIDVIGHVETNVWNKILHLQTPNYQTSNQTVKIFTSMVVGKIEVKRA